MLEFEKVLDSLARVPSHGGREAYAKNEISALFGEYFDSVSSDGARNAILTKKSAKADDIPKKKLMLDAHLDEIGLVVSGIEDSGILRVERVGGVDKSIFSASEVTVWGKEPLLGVVLSSKEGEKKDSEWSELYIDIGYTKKEIESGSLVTLGTAVSYKYEKTALLSRRIASPGLDNKSSAAAIVTAVANTPAEKLAFDVYIVLSSGEEIGRRGAFVAASHILPDLALVADVNFGTSPAIDSSRGNELGGGPVITLSASIDRSLTKALISLFEENELPYSVSVEPSSTGTNAGDLIFAGEGVRTAVFGLPLRSMHSQNEVIDLSDADILAKAIEIFIKTDKYTGVKL